MDNIQCELCRKWFDRKRSQVLLARRHYCSVKCQNLDKKKGDIFSCFFCGKKVYKKNKDVLKSKSKNYFCGIRCSNKWIGSQRQGSNHPNWINGKFSYKNILSRTGTKKICLLCNEENVRVIAVHHVDGNRDNNSITNLTWLCHNCHFLVHHDIEELNRLGILLKINGHK